MVSDVSIRTFPEAIERNPPFRNHKRAAFGNPSFTMRVKWFRAMARNPGKSTVFGPRPLRLSVRLMWL